MNELESKIFQSYKERLGVLARVFAEPLEHYFPKLEDKVRDHLSQWGGFDADQHAEPTQVKGLIDSLVGIADIITDDLAQLRTKKGREMLPLSIVRTAWKREYQFQVENDNPVGFLPRGNRQRGYLVYGAFRRPDSEYSDLTILFQMLDPADDTGEEGLEVHTGVEGEGESAIVKAQGIEVYRVLAGFVEIEIDGEKNTIGPEQEYSTAVVPPGSRHRVINSSDRTSQILILMGGGARRGHKIVDGMIEIEKGVLVQAPAVPDSSQGILRFRKKVNHEA